MDKKYDTHLEKNDDDSSQEENLQRGARAKFWDPEMIKKRFFLRTTRDPRYFLRPIRMHPDFYLRAVGYFPGYLNSIQEPFEFESEVKWPKSRNILISNALKGMKN